MSQAKIVIPHPPNLCTAPGCGDPARLIVCRARDEQGRLCVNAIGQSSFRNSGKNPVLGGCDGEEYYLFGKFKFHSWLARCAACYAEDIKRYHEALTE